MTVSRFCRREVDLVDLDESAWAAAERMRRRDVGSLIVLDRELHPIGIVTERDLVVKVMATEKLPRTTRVRDIMTSPVQTVPETSSAASALGLIRASEFRPLAVVDSGGKLVGMLTLGDVLSHLAHEFPPLAALLGEPSPQVTAVPTDPQ